jgi:hypothetical protein
LHTALAKKKAERNELGLRLRALQDETDRLTAQAVQRASEVQKLSVSVVELCSALDPGSKAETDDRLRTALAAFRKNPKMTQEELQKALMSK